MARLTRRRAFAGSSEQEAKLVTNWVNSMATGDEVALFIANERNTEDITFGRAWLVAGKVE